MRTWAPAMRSFSYASRTEVEPPVICAPSSALVYTAPTGAISTFTLRRSTPSSSAISIGIDVYTPWPISERAEISVMVLSSAMWTQALGVWMVPAARACSAASGRNTPSVRPVAASAVVLMKSRRVVVMARSSGFAHFRGRRVDGGADAVVGAAAADVAAHGVLDVGVAGIFIRVQQGGGAHQLARLAVAALRHVVRDPGLLQRVRIVLRQRLDGGDLLAGDHRQRRLARADRRAVQMHGAGAAQGHAAAELGAGQADFIADDPQQWRVRLGRRRDCFTV